MKPLKRPSKPTPPASPSGTAEVRALLSDSAYLCVFSRSDRGRPNTPIMTATNPVGSLMLGSGLMPLVGALGKLVGMRMLEPLMGLMPLAMIGVEVNEEMHRFDVRGRAPHRQHGVRTSNVVGEAIGSVTMKWMIAPDDFEPGPDRVPPPTPLDVTRSQKFVMLNGRMRYTDGRESGLRGLGSGRTFPVTVNGQPQLRIGAVVDVVEGFGNLAGLTGTIVVNGYVTPPQGLFINFVARFLDPDGQVLTNDPVAACEPEPEADPATSFLVLQAEEGPDPGVEHLRLVHTAFDVRSPAGLRSNLAVGPVVGSVKADLEFNATDAQPVSPLRTQQGLFTFTDAAGRVVGTLAANVVEGRAFKATVKGRPLVRIAGFGPLISGTGAFEGAIGMMSMNAVMSVSPRVRSSLYVLRISDPRRQYRMWIDETANGGTAALTPDDHALATCVDEASRPLRKVREWQRQREADGAYRTRLQLVREVTPLDRSFGFFDTIPLENGPLPVMGVVQEMLFDHAKGAPAAEVRDQLREFVLTYFLRVSHSRRPEAAAPAGQAEAAPFMKPFSWLPEPSSDHGGLGYEQVLYKLHKTGELGAFRPHDRGAIVDLRSLGSRYDWVAMRMRLADFNVSMAPASPVPLAMELPLDQATYLLLTPDAIVNRDDPSADVLGEYGFGYGILPCTTRDMAAAVRPGHFDTGHQSIVFRALKDGTIHARAAFVVNRPGKVMDVDVDPMTWGFRLADLVTFDLASKALAPVKSLVEGWPLRIPGMDPIALYIATANLLSGGLAESQLGISRAQLDASMLVQHFVQHHDMLVHAQQAWRAVPDWTDTDGLPEFCQRGLIR